MESHFSTFRRLHCLHLHENEVFDYYTKELNLVKTELSKKIKDVCFTQKLLLAFHPLCYGSNQASLSANTSPIFWWSRCRPKIIPKSDFRPFFSFEFQKEIASFANSLLKDLDLFVHVSVQLTEQSLSNIDVFVFSTIPSFFNYFLTQECIDRYICFLKSMKKHSVSLNHFAAILFHALPFRWFFNFLLEKTRSFITNPFTEEALQKYFDAFVQNWKDFSEYCPKFIQEVLKLTDDPLKFLSNVIQSYFNNTFDMNSPYNYINEKRPFNTKLKEIISKLLKLILDAEKLLSVDLKIRSNNFLYFSIQDFEILRLLSQYPHESFVACEILSAVPRMNQAFQLFDFTEYEEQNISPIFRPFEDKFQELIYSLLNLIPPNSFLYLSTTDVLEFLMFSLRHYPVESQMQILINITELKKIRPSLNFDELNQYLQKKFDERRPQRLSDFSDLSFVYSELQAFTIAGENLQTLLLIFTKCFENFIVKSFLEQIDVKNLIGPDVKTNMAEFGKFFQDIFSKFTQFCKDSSISSEDSSRLISPFHNEIMKSNFSFSEFQKANPQLVEKDKQLYEMFPQDPWTTLKGAFEKKGYFDLIRKNFHRFADSLFFASQVFSDNSPLYLLDKFYQFTLSTHSTIQIVLSQNEIGQDEILPISCFLISHLKPSTMYSTFCYINHFIEPCREINAFSSKNIGTTIDNFQADLTSKLAGSVSEEHRLEASTIFNPT